MGFATYPALAQDAALYGIRRVKQGGPPAVLSPDTVGLPPPAGALLSLFSHGGGNGSAAGSTTSNGGGYSEDNPDDFGDW